jgi:uncharacterized membrane protein HdeD (DUF308 family)
MSTVHARRNMQSLGPLAANWWLMAARGVLAIGLGVTMLVWRTPVLDAIVLPFATYAVIDGALAIAAVLRAARPRIAGWPMALEGAVSVALGVLAVVWPFLSTRVIVTIAAWGLLTGILELVTAARLPRQMAPFWLVGTGGALSVFLALLVAALPRAESHVVATILGVYAIVFGVSFLLASLGFRAAVRS